MGFVGCWSVANFDGNLVYLAINFNRTDRKLTVFCDSTFS